MSALLAAFGWLLELVRRYRVRAHRAEFWLPQGELPEDSGFTRTGTVTVDTVTCLFINVTNLSPRREVEVTHVWVETDPPTQVLNPDRPLPARLRLDESWETWIELSRLPGDLQEVERQARVRLSNGTVLKSRLSRDVPPAGYVPGAGRWSR